MLHSILELPNSHSISPILIKNFDASVFLIDGRIAERVYATPEAIHSKTPIVSSRSDRRSFYVHVMVLTNAAGCLDSFLCVLVFKGFPPTKILKLQVHGMLQYPDLDGDLWIVGDINSPAFFQEILNQFVFPAFERGFNELKQHPRSLPFKEERGILLIDGDPDQLGVLTIPENLTKFVENKIDVIKTAASTSGIEQPNDVAPIFRNLRKFLNNETYADEVNEHIMECVDKSLNELLGTRSQKQALGISDQKSGMSLSTKIRRTVEVLHPIFPQVFTRHNIKVGFLTSGVNPYDARQILAQTRGIARFTDEEQKAMLVAIEALKEHSAEYYKVSETLMDQYGVPKIPKQLEIESKPNRKQRDNLVLYRQRSCVLTHESLQPRLEEWKRQKEEKKKAKLEREQKKKDRAMKREQKIRHAAAVKRKLRLARVGRPESDEWESDCQCALCGGWFGKFQEVGLPNDEREFRWHGCKRCPQWFINSCCSYCDQ